ncbi:MAG: hypothetical protein LC113_07370 [Acidobacteria bacterium]|nr:hypothetical protein [Acidobacteriota bacterium]
MEQVRYPPSGKLDFTSLRVLTTSPIDIETTALEIKAVNTIRNEVMPFGPDPLEKEKLDTLRRAPRMIRGFRHFSKKVTPASQVA